MAKKARPRKKTTKKVGWFKRQRQRVRLVVVRGLLGVVAVFLLAIAFYGLVDPPTTWTIYSERERLGEVDFQWVDAEDVAPVVFRSVVAAEDANFCDHWGFDMSAIRDAIADGADRGASTLTQQTVKNVYLWQGRSWVRKALEAVTTPFVELIWTKRRILEVYVNVAEFDEGVFGVDAAAQHYFGILPSQLNAAQAARLAAILPNPKQRSASRPSNAVVKRAAQIIDGAATIQKDGRAACFE
ncbi:monofunctional biosynthetic peptidoglycan transglycosylase [Cognatishimia sp.]|uniref:monofunctional biosynthetic peptidoglycan transglycosylase n=1 Tax=Cognatishimia sp. TaxID=2211648 RepID=UPI0035193A2E|nr:monofunctional biosynthetic peptidoglycan transglycosylase [Cognatishimia sp.]